MTTFNRCCSVLALTILAIDPIPVLSAPKISGNPEGVVVDTQNSSIGDVLSALGRDFNFHFRSSVSLEKPITGLYQGSLRQVVAHILEGYSYTLRLSAGGVDLTVLAAPGTDLGGSSNRTELTPSSDPYSFLHRNR